MGRVQFSQILIWILIAVIIFNLGWFTSNYTMKESLKPASLPPQQTDQVKGDNLETMSDDTGEEIQVKNDIDVKIIPADRGLKDDRALPQRIALKLTTIAQPMQLPEVVHVALQGQPQIEPQAHPQVQPQEQSINVMVYRQEVGIPGDNVVMPVPDIGGEVAVVVEPNWSILALVNVNLPDDTQPSVCITCIDTNDKRFPLCVLSTVYDPLISGSIRENRGHLPDVEYGIMETIDGIMASRHGTGLIDVGAALGHVSVHVALQGRPVVAVEPRLLEMRMMSKTLQMSGLSDVTTVHASVGDNHGQVYVSVGLTADSTTLLPVVECAEDVCNINQPIQVIYFDDLVEVIYFKQAILRIDLQEFYPNEYQVFTNADKLFSSVDIVLIWMKWTLLIRRPENSPRTIVDYLVNKGYKPVVNEVNGEESLLVNEWDQWPVDILWSRLWSSSPSKRLLIATIFLNTSVSWNHEILIFCM